MGAQWKLEAATSVVVLGSPIIVEGLRSIGCDVVASTGFLAQLPVIAARVRPAMVVVHSDARDPEALLSCLHSLRSALPAVRLVVMLPVARASHLVGAFSALDVEAVGDDCTAMSLRALLGLESPAPSLLTRREIDVLKLAAEGLSNQAIGRRLGLQMNTVKNYLRSVHRKLGARSRTEAVMMAARAGYPVLSLR